MRRTPALIVGGGLAGAATAIGLARAGLPHLLVERSRETGDAICGGFLSWRTLETLAGLGIDPDTLNPTRVTRARIYAGTRRADAALPHAAVSVTRRRLDSVMLAQAERLGTPIERGVTVREIDGLTVRTADGATFAPDALFLASGKQDVRGMARPETARGIDPTLGLRVRIAPSPRCAARSTVASNCTCSIAAMRGLPCRRMAPRTCASRCIARGCRLPDHLRSCWRRWGATCPRSGNGSR
ncbi:FAD-dependent monooxygenase [Sphingomonas aurantiaca]|uniref:NAD(P)/FAD-dependent oxidoreductase n=1 Tax=Sphingomonas aurantiaca TaxID=185949 RepID=UPI002FE3A7C1